jgi:hypothetical protein
MKRWWQVVAAVVAVLAVAYVVLNRSDGSEGRALPARRRQRRYWRAVNT